MKQFFFAATALSFSLAAGAQQTEGTATYTRTMQMRITARADDPVMSMLPQTRTDKFELVFGNNQSIWKHVDEEADPGEINANGMQIRMMTPGQNDIVFSDFGQARKTEQREMMERKFLVSDSLRRLNWILGSDTKTILGHVCRKATAQRFGKRTQMNMENGKFERKEVADTSTITAWFTSDIPVPAGPEVQGQLPGLILALDINNGRVVYQATELSPKADLSALKEPSKGKKLTPEEYTQETTKMMEEMQKNNMGGNRVFRVN